MRSIVLALALLVAGSAVLMAVSASHQGSDKSPGTEPQAQPAQQQPTPTDGVPRVTVEELRAGLEKGTAVVIDVRTEEQYKAGHIKGARWIPSNEIAGRIKELPKDKLVVAYCS